MNKKTKTLLLVYEIIKGRDLANNFPSSTPKLNRKHSESRHLLFFFFYSDSVHSYFGCLSGIWISFSRTQNLYSHVRNTVLFGGCAQKKGQLSCGVTSWLVSRESIMASWKLEKVVSTSKASIPLACIHWISVMRWDLVHGVIRKPRLARGGAQTGRSCKLLNKSGASRVWSWSILQRLVC